MHVPASRTLALSEYKPNVTPGILHGTNGKLLEYVRIWRFRQDFARRGKFKDVLSAEKGMRAGIQAVARWRANARRTSRSTSGPNSMPACLAASGSRLLEVKPGSVLISSKYGLLRLSSMT